MKLEDIQSVFYALPGAYLIIRPDLFIVDANDLLLKLILKKREEITGKYLFDVLPDNPDNPAANGVSKWKSSLDYVLSHKVRHDMEITRYDVSGADNITGSFQVRYWMPSNIPVLDKRGTLQFIIHYTVDITEQIENQHHILELTAKNEQLLEGERRARKEAEEQRVMLENLIMNAPAMICMLSGPDLVFRLVNPHYQALFPGKQLVGKTVLEAIPEIRDQQIIDVLQNVYKTGVTFYGNEIPLLLDRYGTGTMQTMYFNFIYQATRDVKGNIDGIIAFAYQITELVEARQIIEQSASQIKQVLESLPQMAWTALPDGNVNYLNKRWYDYTGQSPEKALGYGWADATHPQDVPLLMPQWSYALEKGTLYEAEARYLRASDGVYLWHLVRATPIRNEKGQILLWVGTCTDIDELKGTQAQLQALSDELTASNEELATANEEIYANNKELKEVNLRLSSVNADLDNFIYTASHDLKAPVNNIEGLMALLARQLVQNKYMDDSIKGLLNMINASVNRFKATIVDLTEIAKVQKQFDDAYEVVNIAEVMEDILLDLRQSIQDSAYQIAQHLEECPQITFSKKNFKSILYNLLSNAIKYRDPERKLYIQIYCQREDNYLVLSVRDNGLGMDTRDESKIFGMFKRLHTHVEGTGVGLYIIKKMIENAGGKIKVESQVGKGSVFHVYFKL
jgi:PAS domain S-box-containing protein